MNDSMEILRRGFSCINQFPWLYVAVVKPFALISRYLFHSYEPAIFLLSFIQMGVMAYGLAYSSCFIGKALNNHLLPWILAVYFAFFPRVGNYAGAFVRDPLYSLGLVLLTLFLFQIQNKHLWLRTNSVEFFCLSIALMGLRNNAIYILGFIVLVLYFVFSKEIWKKICLAFVASVLAITIPGKVIMSYKHITPLFQRSRWNSTAASRPHNCVRWYLDRIGIKHFFRHIPFRIMEITVYTEYG